MFYSIKIGSRVPGKRSYELLSVRAGCTTCIDSEGDLVYRERAPLFACVWDVRSGRYERNSVLLTVQAYSEEDVADLRRFAREDLADAVLEVDVEGPYTGDLTNYYAIVRAFRPKTLVVRDADVAQIRAHYELLESGSELVAVAMRAYDADETMFDFQREDVKFTVDSTYNMRVLSAALRSSRIERVFSMDVNSAWLIEDVYENVDRYRARKIMLVVPSQGVSAEDVTRAIVARGVVDVTASPFHGGISVNRDDETRVGHTIVEFFGARKGTLGAFLGGTEGKVTDLILRFLGRAELLPLCRPHQ